MLQISDNHFKMPAGKIREVLLQMDFNNPIDDRGRFSNLYDAEHWCKTHGYSVGNSCANAPTGLMIGKYDWIAKWKNLTSQEKSKLDGVMQSIFNDGYRVVLFNLSKEAQTFLTDIKLRNDPNCTIIQDGKRILELKFSPDSHILTVINSEYDIWSRNQDEVK